jgi:hypothetical protein
MRSGKSLAGSFESVMLKKAVLSAEVTLADKTALLHVGA